MICVMQIKSAHLFVIQIVMKGLRSVVDDKTRSQVCSYLMELQRLSSSCHNPTDITKREMETASLFQKVSAPIIMLFY